MRDHLFEWALIVLTLLGVTEIIIESLFWRRLRSIDPGAGPRLIGVEWNDRQRAGIRRLWQFYTRRDYVQLNDGRATSLGDLTRMVYIAWAAAMLLFAAMFVARGMKIL